MKMKRIIATLLSVAMLLSSYVFLFPTTAAAATTTDAEEELTPLDDYLTATTAAIEDRAYASAQEYLDKFMELRVQTNQFALYTNPYTGEVAIKNLLTGQILSTNPYAFGEITVDDSTLTPTEETSWWMVDDIKKELLSQVIINYKDSTGTSKTMNSFAESAMRGQIVMKDIKNGVRVEYIIGRLNANYLLPASIMKDRFEQEILAPVEARLDELLLSYGETNLYDEEKEASGMTRVEYYESLMKDYHSTEYKIFQNTYFAYRQLIASYALQDPNANLSTSTIKSMQESYPVTAEKGSDGKYKAIYILDTGLRDNSKTTLEGYVKTYCTDYGYDDLEADHKETKYVAEEEQQALFRLALEYVIEQDGMSIRLPAAGIRYDESFLTLEDIAIAPYFGAGNMMNDGYVFYPDGSGSILEFQDLYNDHEKISNAPSSKVYGEDYAYYTITGQHQEAIRMPVYGLVETELKTKVDPETLQDVVYEETRGYLAIITEGDALTELTAEFGASEHPYASVYSVVTPRPTDEYDLANSLSASGTGEQKWTVVSDRKYIGNYKTSIIMLTDKTIGSELVAEGKLDAYYNADWIGMAKAYRNYLETKNLITPLTNEDVKAQLPLYIETFGTIETTETFLSLPITVDVALTTFGNISKMYDDLALQGISNVNFRLVGFANGGMEYRYPVKLEWQDEAGGSSGFKKLIADADAKGYGVYPDFDFLYINEDDWFDGVSTRDIAVRTVDDRYASKQVYDAVYQDFQSYFSICVASSELLGSFKTFEKKYDNYGLANLSLALFATDLNSNFDEDNPTNRADAKEHYIEFLELASKDYSVMTEGGNIYTVPYVDHMLNMPIESSNYSYSSYSVPFIGMILHGYLNYAGSPFNEAGDVDYNIMRSIENGMAPYYVLSYNSDNTALMKKDYVLSQYYSIRYDIWFGQENDDGSFTKGELLKQYHLLNAAIGDLQTARINDYMLLHYERVHTAEEIKNDELTVLANIATAISTAAQKAQANKIREFRRELEIYSKIYEIKNENPDILDKDLTDRLAAHLQGTVYANESIYTAEAVEAKAIEFVNMFYAEGTNDTNLAESLPIDDYVLAEAVCRDVDLLKSLYRACLTQLPPDAVRPGPEEINNNINLMLEEATQFINRVAAAFVADYYSGDLKEETGKTVMVIVDRDAVIESIKATIGVDNLTVDQIKAVDQAIAAINFNMDSFLNAFESALKQTNVKFALTAAQRKAITDEILLVNVDNAAFIAKALAIVGVLPETLNDAQNAAIETAIAEATKTTANAIVTVTEVDLEYTSSFTESMATDSDKDYHYTPYTLYDSRCVMVTYDKDTSSAKFVLNYNLFDVEVRYTSEKPFSLTYFAEDGTKTVKTYDANEIVTIIVPAYTFVRIDG